MAQHRIRDTFMVRQEKTTLVLGWLAVCAGVVVVLAALYLGFYIEGTPQAVARSAKGHRIAVPAVIGVIAGVVALAGRRRGWALAVSCVGATAAVVAVLLTVLLRAD